MKLRPGEKENWIKTCCYILTLAKAVEILKTPQNPNFWVPKKILVDCTATCCYSWETELVGRAEKGVMPTAPSVPRRSPGGAPSQTASTLRANVAAFEHKSIHLMDSIATYFLLFSAVCFELKICPQKPQLGRQLPYCISMALAFQGRVGILPWPVVCIASRPFG